jgi:hypothetical protein
MRGPEEQMSIESKVLLGLGRISHRDPVVVRTISGNGHKMNVFPAGDKLAYHGFGTSIIRLMHRF